MRRAAANTSEREGGGGREGWEMGVCSHEGAGGIVVILVRHSGYIRERLFGADGCGTEMMLADGPPSSPASLPL